MFINAMLLSSLLMLPVSSVQIDELKKLSSSEPDKAVQRYSELLKQAQIDNTDKQVLTDLHFEGLLAALNASQWSTFVSIVKRLSSPELSIYVEPIKFNLVTRIGVAYRFNYQLEQARKHYTCALDLSASDIELATLKVNLAIVYRLSEQPAMAYQLINSIDQKQLSMRVKAGYFVVRGNILTSLGKFEEAVSSFEQARGFYGKLGNAISAAGVTLNILGASLSGNLLSTFSHYRQGYETLVDEQDMESLQYLQWLDLIAQAIKTKEVTLAQERWLAEHVKPLIKRGFGADVKAHLKVVDKAYLYPKQKPIRLGKTLLPESMAQPWCPTL
ncbi:hypothetical protein PA25_37190 [Pseudoalteromonas sp. A25]|uniref:hypothetical protein n=1 Tax=Pseudoalteromonas sp. A25 TaxID=116092 RepID=UPI0012607632|nr:hypothetical protein [Pseudoalteromonas sp. A25]BBN83734.1 hypothetical protein PA25_37190 [Pseudoalteromonas sp. A25]